MKKKRCSGIIFIIFLGSLLFFLCRGIFLRLADFKDEMSREFIKLRNRNIYYPLRYVKVYAYTNVKEMTDDDPDTMASGRKVYEGALAVSRDFVERGELYFGDKVWLDDYGLFVVEDLMAARHTNSVDIFLFSLETVKKFGYKRKRLWLIRENWRG